MLPPLYTKGPTELLVTIFQVFFCFMWLLLYGGIDIVGLPNFCAKSDPPNLQTRTV